MISVKEYLMGREKDHPLSVEQALNCANLLIRVNLLLKTLGFNGRVSSGYRPEAINKKVGGAKKSAHISCSAIDIADPMRELAKLLRANIKLLEEYGLWLESPDKTKGWIHLDIIERKNRVFIP